MLLSAALGVAAACTGGDDGTDPVDRQAVAARVAAAGVGLDEPALDCTVDELDDDLLATLGGGDELPIEVADALARAATDCAGPDVIAEASLGVISGGASADSLTCAADVFDPDLVVALLRGNLTGVSGDADQARLVELEVAVSLGECLTPDELAALGR